jgi:hypothetical protein
MSVEEQPSIVPVEEASRERPLAERPGDPPVVARLVVEIRSDGTRTIARGAMEDLTLGQKMAMEAEGGSPAQLAASMLRSLAKLPVMAAAPELVRGALVVQGVLRALLPGKKRDR